MAELKIDEKYLERLGISVVKEIKKKVFEMDLYDTGAFVNSINYKIDGGNLFVFSDLDYSEALEYGTYQLIDISKGIVNKPVPVKKKDISKSAAKNLPKGGGAFAPIRRVIYNKAIMDKLMIEALE